MQLENIATPQPSAPPQLRYATLHRAVERGMASDEVWYDLAQVCLQLGHDEEAVRTWRLMQDGAAKNRLESTLVRRGLIDPPVRRSRREAADPGQPSPVGMLEPEAGPTLMDHLRDALHFLTMERMPLLVLVSMLAFPLVVGLGGFLTAGGSPLLLPAIAALPGLCVLGIVGALGRRVLVDAACGEESPPALPELGALARQAVRYLTDATVIVAAMLGPTVVMVALHAPWISVLPGLVLGAFFLPMALALRQVRDDWRAMSLSFLLTAIGRTCTRYVGIVAVFWAMFLPAAALIVATAGMRVWLQIAAVGPFMVLPVFTTARMLGTFLDAQRLELGVILGTKARRVLPVEPTGVTASQPRVRHKASLRSQRAVTPRLPTAPDDIASKQAQNTTPAKAPAPAPHAAKAAPARAAPAKTPPARPAAAPKPAARKAPPRAARTSPPQPGIDLPQGLSAAAIVSGVDRERLGAAARRE